MYVQHKNLDREVVTRITLVKRVINRLSGTSEKAHRADILSCMDWKRPFRLHLRTYKYQLRADMGVHSLVKYSERRSAPPLQADMVLLYKGHRLLQVAVS